MYTYTVFFLNNRNFEKSYTIFYILIDTNTGINNNNNHKYKIFRKIDILKDVPIFISGLSILGFLKKPIFISVNKTLNKPPAAFQNMKKLCPGSYFRRNMVICFLTNKKFQANLGLLHISIFPW